MLSAPAALACNGGWASLSEGRGGARVREAIVQKIPEFYEIISQTGRGGQSDFISLIQKKLLPQNQWQNLNEDFIKAERGGRGGVTVL